MTQLFIAVVGLLAVKAIADCVAYGKDFQNGGIYFQNASSAEQFSFVQYFEGCEHDYSSNILIDPTAEEYQCSQTALAPDDADQLSTCPIAKSDLYSGDWSIIIASNNGAGQPIAYERDFSLIVGVPTTITYYPTVTVISTETPVSTASITTTVQGTTTVTQSVTSPSVTFTPTITTTPRAKITTSYLITGTVIKTVFRAAPLITTSYSTKSCSLPSSQSAPDTTAQYSPTLLSTTTANKRSELPPDTVLLVSDGGKVNLDNVRKSPEKFIEERRKRLADAAKIVRRGLDQATTVITATDPKQFITATSVVRATSTSTITTTVEVTTYSTITSTTTVLSGTTTMKQTTVTAPKPTSTKTVQINTTIRSTVTQKPLITITVATATSGAYASCKSLGGKLV